MTDDETRRAWMLRLGEATILLGLSGSDVEAAPAELPPGLYDASPDHLGHALTNAPSKLRTVPYKPQFFTPEEFQIVGRVVGLILGPTRDPAVVSEIAEWIDTTVFDEAAIHIAVHALSPGHRSLANHFYGEAAVREMETSTEQQTCREGLRQLSEKHFLHLSPSEQTALLTATTGFLQLMKTKCIHGYYTSRTGLKELDYKGNAFYSISPGCDGHDH